MPLEQLLFSIEYNLSKEFPSMDPMEIEERPYVKVINLYSDVRRMQIRQKKMSDPNRVIRRPAGDNWF